MLMYCAPAWRPASRVTMAGSGVLSVVNTGPRRVKIQVTDTDQSDSPKSSLLVDSGKSETLSVTAGERVWFASVITIAKIEISGPAFTVENGSIVNQFGEDVATTKVGDQLHLIGPIGGDGTAQEWRLDGAPIAGETSVTLTVESDQGAITAVGQGSIGAVTIDGSVPHLQRPVKIAEVSKIDISGPFAVIPAATIQAAFGGGEIDSIEASGGNVLADNSVQVYGDFRGMRVVTITAINSRGRDSINVEVEPVLPTYTPPVSSTDPAILDEFSPERTLYESGGWAFPNTAERQTLQSALDGLTADTGSATVSGVDRNLASLASAAGVSLSYALPNDYGARVSDGRITAETVLRLSNIGALEDGFKPAVFSENQFYWENGEGVWSSGGLTDVHCHVIAWHRRSSIPGVNVTGSTYTIDPGTWASALAEPTKTNFFTYLDAHLDALRAAVDDTSNGLSITSIDVINEFCLQSTADGWRVSEAIDANFDRDANTSPWIAAAEAWYPGDKSAAVVAFVGELVDHVIAKLPNVKIAITDFDTEYDQPLYPTQRAGDTSAWTVDLYGGGAEQLFFAYGDLQRKSHRTLWLIRQLKKAGKQVDVFGMQFHLFSGRAFSAEGVAQKMQAAKALGLEVWLTELNIKTQTATYPVFAAQTNTYANLADQAYFASWYLYKFLEAVAPYLDGLILWSSTSDSGPRTAWTAFGEDPGAASGDPMKVQPGWLALSRVFQQLRDGEIERTNETAHLLDFKRHVPYEVVATGSPTVNRFGAVNSAGGSMSVDPADAFPGGDLAADTVTVTWSHTTDSSGGTLVAFAANSSPTAQTEIRIGSDNVVTLTDGTNTASVGTAQSGSRQRVAVVKSGGATYAALNGGAAVSIPTTETWGAIGLGNAVGGASSFTTNPPRIEIVRLFSGNVVSTQSIPELATYVPHIAPALVATASDESEADIKIQTSDGSGFAVDWGDGTLDVGASDDTISRSYSPNFTGDVKVYASGPVSSVTTSNGNLHFALSDLPPSVSHVRLLGQGAVSVGASAWATTLRYVRIDGPLSSGDVDQLLINLSAVSNWTGASRIDLQYGGAAPRTSASDAAVATLQSNGVTVNTA